MDARRLLVVRLGSLGDLVHTLPAVSAIHRADPELEIDWLVDVVHREFLELVPLIASIIPLRAPTVRGWLEARRRLQARRYALAVDFQGLIKSAMLARLSGAGRVAGFGRKALREPAAAWLYSDRADVGEAGHVIDKNLRLAHAVGGRGDAYEFPLAPVASAALDEVKASGMGAFALLNCGAAWPNKRWPAERFGRLAAWLHARHGLWSVVLWGPGEAELAAAAAAASGGTAVVAPPTSLSDLVALSREARLMVSGDTGPTHIAAAVGTPIVALFGPTSPARNGPWNPADRTLSRYETCGCHYRRRCRRGPDTWCLGTITEDEVRGAIDERLGAAGA